MEAEQDPRRNRKAMLGRSVLNRKSSVLAALALLGALGLACTRAPSTAERLDHQANLAYRSADYGSALEQYRRAEVLRPDLPAISYNTGNALIRQNDFQRAIDEEKRAAVSTDPDVQDRAYYSLGDAEVRTNQLREAVDAYKSALRANPSDMDAKYNLEVIQRRLTQDQARQQAVQNQEKQPTPTAAPTVQPTSTTQPTPQGLAQPPPPGQTAQPGQGQAGQPGQQVPGPRGQPAQAGQTAQPSAAGQRAQPSQTPQPAPSARNAPNGQGQAGPPPTGSVGGTASGYTGTAAGQANTLDPSVQRALNQFDQSQSIDDALRALDLIAQQEQIRQAALDGGGQAQGRDW